MGGLRGGGGGSEQLWAGTGGLLRKAVLVAARLAWAGRMPPFCWAPWRSCWAQAYSPPAPGGDVLLPTAASSLFHIRLWWALMPYEFRTKESEAHGLSLQGAVVWK